MDKKLQDRFIEIGEATETTMSGKMPSIDTLQHGIEGSSFLLELLKIKDLRTIVEILRDNQEKYEFLQKEYDNGTKNQQTLDNCAMSMLKIHFCRQHIKQKFNVNPDDMYELTQALSKKKKFFGLF